MPLTQSSSTTTIVVVELGPSKKVVVLQRNQQDLFIFKWLSINLFYLIISFTKLWGKNQQPKTMIVLTTIVTRKKLFILYNLYNTLQTIDLVESYFIQIRHAVTNFKYNNQQIVISTIITTKILSCNLRWSLELGCSTETYSKK